MDNTNGGYIRTHIALQGVLVVEIALAVSQVTPGKNPALAQNASLLPIPKASNKRFLIVHFPM
jgi:hypothetical protein